MPLQIARQRTPQFDRLQCDSLCLLCGSSAFQFQIVQVIKKRSGSTSGVYWVDNDGEHHWARLSSRSCSVRWLIFDTPQREVITPSNTADGDRLCSRWRSALETDARMPNNLGNLKHLKSGSNLFLVTFFSWLMVVGSFETFKEANAFGTILLVIFFEKS